MIARVEPIEADSIPPADDGWKRRVYSSPEGDWTLLLHGSFEWHMGATGWKAKILHAGRDVSRRHKAVLAKAGKKGFQSFTDYQPWAFGHPRLALATWDPSNPVHILDAETGDTVAIESGVGQPVSVQFAPGIERLLISFADRGALYDFRAGLHVTIPWQKPESEPARAFWTGAARLISIMRESADAGTMLRAYSGADGRVQEARRLDPRDLVPYDHDRYAGIASAGFLRVGANTWSDGSMLDRWNDIRFERSSTRLLLSVFRPVSAPYAGPMRPGCDVTEAWVAVELET